MKTRDKIVKQAQAWLGKNERDGSFREIIDIYNRIYPLPVGYKVKYSDEWCAAFISALGQACGMTDVILPECGCERMIRLYRAKGLWQEQDDYIPKSGDILMYDWQDSGVGDCTGTADHVALVEKVENGYIHLIEGNRSQSVKRITIPINSRQIRGFCLPAYEEGKEPEIIEGADEMAFRIEFETKAIADKYAAKLKAEGFACFVTGTDEPTPQPPIQFKRGDVVRMSRDATIYGKQSKYASFVYDSILYILEVSGDRALVSTRKDGQITGPVHIKYLTRI